MPTTIVSSPNIQGDISSCKTEITYLNGASRNSLFTVENVGYATNNCTGQTDTFNSWTLSGFSAGLIVIFGTILVIGFFKWVLDA